MKAISSEGKFLPIYWNNYQIFNDINKKDIHKGKQPACTGLTQLVPVVHVCALWISCFMKVAIFGSKLAT